MSNCNCKKYCMHKFNKDCNKYAPMYTVFHVITMLFALYLCFKCNNGFDSLEFFFALFCPVLYIIYKAAVAPNFCNVLTFPAPALVK